MDDGWMSDSNVRAGSAASNWTAHEPLRLYHFAQRSVSECRWKRTCALLETNHGTAPGWREMQADLCERAACGGSEPDATSCATWPVDTTLAALATPTREAMRAIFGEGAATLHAALGAQFRRRLQLDTAGGTVLPPRGVDGRFVDREAID